MRKALYTLLILLVLIMCSCSVTDSDLFKDNNVKWLKNWSFQFNEESNDYSIFFSLHNKNNEEISEDVNVDIRIVNEEDEEVYIGTKSVSKNDFAHYTSVLAGKQYLAELRIPAQDIISGKSSNGTVYLTVYKNDTFGFDEVNCSANNCLPIEDVNLISDTFPFSIDVKGYDGSIQSTIQIDDISYTFEKDYVPKIKVTVFGTKTYGKQNLMSGYDIISYKLYDSEEYMVDSGNIYLDSLGEGDKFKNDSIVIYDIIPGESYKLIFSNIGY